MVPMCAGITLTSDPEGRAAMGGSSGGCAAFTMAWCRPDLFRRVLTYSGKYAPCSVQSRGLDREAISQAGLMLHVAPRPHSKISAQRRCHHFDIVNEIVKQTCACRCAGTYVNQQYPFNPELPGGCWEYHAGQELIASSEKKPLKVLLFVSDCYSCSCCTCSCALRFEFNAMASDFRYTRAVL
jgi:hypothetical protein